MYKTQIIIGNFIILIFNFIFCSAINQEVRVVFKIFVYNHIQETLQNAQNMLEELPEQIFTPVQQNLASLEQQHVITGGWIQAQQYFNYF